MRNSSKQTRGAKSEQSAETAEEPVITMSDQQIERVVERATKFLATLSRNGRIRGILDQGGYTQDEHKEGWSLLLALLGYNAGSPASADEASSPASKAIAELDQWDGPSFARAQAALAHKHPEQAAYVFAGLSAKSGADSIAAVGTFLDRIAVLRAGSDPDRKEMRASDKAAVELLAKRRILDTKIEARLRELIDAATALAPASKVEEVAPEDRQVTAQKLGAWLDDWRETARALVIRRDYRIALGLAQRRTANGGTDEAEETSTEPVGTVGAPAMDDVVTDS